MSTQPIEPAAPAAQAPAPTPAPVAPATVTPSAPEAQDVASLPEWAQKALRDARAEAAGSRATAKANAADQATQDVLGKVLGALGIDADGKKKVTVDEVTAQLADAKTDGLQARTHLAVYRSAGKHGADADALLDSNSFLASIKGLDPSDAEKIDAAITAAVTSNPKLKAQAAGKSGGEFSGGTGEQPKDIRQQIADAEAKGDWNTSRRLKTHLLIKGQ